MIESSNHCHIVLITFVRTYESHVIFHLICTAELMKLEKLAELFLQMNYKEKSIENMILTIKNLDIDLFVG